MSQALLRHDIGKYLTRAARNLGAAAISPALAGMLVHDLYEAPGGGRPAQRFAALAQAIDPGVAAEIARLFRELDRLEAEIRRQDQAAMRAGAAVALRIARLVDEATCGDEHR